MDAESGILSCRIVGIDGNQTTVLVDFSTRSRLRILEAPPHNTAAVGGVIIVREDTDPKQAWGALLGELAGSSADPRVFGRLSQVTFEDEVSLPALLTEPFELSSLGIAFGSGADERLLCVRGHPAITFRTERDAHRAALDPSSDPLSPWRDAALQDIGEAIAHVRSRGFRVGAGDGDVDEVSLIAEMATVGSFGQQASKWKRDLASPFLALEQGLDQLELAASQALTMAATVSQFRLAAAETSRATADRQINRVLGLITAILLAPGLVFAIAGANFVQVAADDRWPAAVLAAGVAGIAAGGATLLLSNLAGQDASRWAVGCIALGVLASLVAVVLLTGAA